MSDTEVTPGLDRRSLIKKGLVGAGIAATAPVISTFNVAAFAASLDGCHTIQYKITPSSGSVVVDPAIVGCLPAGWVAPDGVIDSFITVTLQPGNVWRFTLNNLTDCHFTAGAANKNVNDCTQFPPPSATWVLNGPGTQLDFDRDGLSNDNAEFHIRLVICCP